MYEGVRMPSFPCDGRELPIAEYRKLFDALWNTNGIIWRTATTFKIPKVEPERCLDSFSVAVRFINAAGEFFVQKFEEEQLIKYGLNKTIQASCKW